MTAATYNFSDPAVQAAVLTIVQRCREMQLTNDRVEWIEGFAFRSPRSLPITFRTERDP